MTSKNVDLREIVGNLLTEGNGASLRNALTCVLREYMEVEAAARGNADCGVRPLGPMNSRNGTRERPLGTRLETIDLEIPRLRQGSYLPSFLTPPRPWEQAFVEAMGASLGARCSWRSE